MAGRRSAAEPRRNRVASERTLVRPVVLCGGAGSRLWPLSNSRTPKQLLIVQPPETMLQATVRRCSGTQFAAPIIVTAEDHRQLVADQLRDGAVKPSLIILEPARRNTAAAVALASFLERSRNPRQLLLVVPADHVIADVSAFRAAVRSAIPAARSGAIVTFGVQPTRPETGFGYIEVGAPVAGRPDVRDVARFVEKPNALAAASYVADGRHLWNAGILLAEAKTLTDELAAHAAQVSCACEAAVRNGKLHDGFLRPERSAFLSSPSESIDCAVMERTDRACVLPVNMRWSDVGSWNALWEISERDANANATSGEVVTHETSGCLIKGEANTTIAALGVRDLVIVATGNAVLVAPRDRAQDLKHIVEGLPAVATHGGNCPIARKSALASVEIRTKLTVVQPNQQLSVVQHYCSEHWIVITGTARLIAGTDARTLRENDSAFVAAGSTATIENIAQMPLQLLQVQRVSKADLAERADESAGPSFPAVA